MTQIKVSCLGVFQVSMGEVRLQFETDKVGALLAYLAVETGRPQRREHLAGLLWSDQPEERALHNLRQALSSLRRTLKDDSQSPAVLRVEREGIQLNPECKVWLDVHAFRESLGQAYRHYQRRTGKGKLNVRALQQALALYRGSFLDQFYLSGSPLFDEWSSLQREALNQQTIEALGLLSEYHEKRGEYALARQAATRIVEMAPWEENAYTRVMRLLAYDGQWTAASTQYQALRRYLSDELGVEPMDETLALHEEIRQAAARQTPLTPARAPVVHNLPSSSTPFVGREAELEQMSAFIANPDCRLLTLLGAGGIGKTRLALEAASEQVGLFEQGVFFVALASLPSSDLLASAIADTLGFHFTGSADPRKQILDYLGGKEMLLVLDNFEHLLEGAEFVAELLVEAQELVILVTSRLPLQLRAECILDVQGLDLPTAVQPLEVAEGRQRYSALALFEQSAQRVRPRFRLEEEFSSVVRICQLVEGSPLAIELSAAGVRQLSCAEIAEGIENDLDVLATSMPDVPERHRSVRAVFNHSWKLLSDDEQAIFRKLAVFSGGFTAQAASVVTGADTRYLRAMVGKSLLHTHTAERYELHRLVEQFTMEQLAENETEYADTHDKHAAYYASFLESLAQVIRGHGQLTALEAIGEEIENVRSAWQWAVKLEQVDWLAQMLSTLGYFYEIRSWFQEGRDVFANATTTLRAGDSHVGQEGVVGQLLVQQALFENLLGQHEQARSLAEAGLAKLRQQAEGAALRRGLNILGAALYELGEREKAADYFEESYGLEGDASDKAFASVYLGHLARNRGDIPSAREYFEESLALYTDLGDLWGRSKNLSNVGMIYGMVGEYEQAQSAFEQSQEIYTEIGDRAGLARCLHNLSIVAYIGQDFVRARDLRLECLEICRDIGFQWGVASTLKHLGDVEKSLGNLEGARKYYQESLQASEQLGNHELRMSSLNSLANLFIAQGNLGRAQASYLEAFELAISLGAVPVVVDVVVGIGEVQLLLGWLEEAGKLLGFASAFQGADHQTHEKAEQLLGELAKKLTAEKIEALRKQGQETPYDEIIQFARNLPTTAP